MPVPNLNRSSSPLSSRPTPNSRNSESNSTTRRSFSGNPFRKPPPLANPRSFNPPTPANSPSGFGRRLSGHYESSEHEKENDQSIKPVKSRSAAIGFGSKNFMAPTISAACKVSPSPRKKVLVDRNEAVRTSISLSEGKATFFSSNDEDILPKFESSIDQKNAERPSVPKVMKRVRFAASTLDSRNSTEFEADSVVSDSDCVVTDLNTKNKSFCDSKPSPIIAPLDADPSVHPYDPKTNYLSPRPQFFHYKPNERIEIPLNKENGLDDEGVKLFEDNLSSLENSSDTDELQRDSEDFSSAEIEPLKVREEDVLGSESLICGGLNNHENSEKVIHGKQREKRGTNESQRDSEDSSSAEIEPPKVREEDVHGPESLICGGLNNHENSEKVIHGKQRQKRGLVTRLGLILLLVVLLVSCFSIAVTYSPGTDSTMLKAMNISQLHQPGAIIDLAKANFNGFTQKFKQLSVESMSHLSLLINNFGQEDQLSSLQFINLTELQNNNFDGGYPKIQQRSEKSPEYLEWDYMKDDAESFEEDTFGDSVPHNSSENEVERDGDDLVLTEAFPAAEGPIGGLASETICNQEEDVSHLNTDWQDNMVPEHYVVAIAPEIQVLTESSLDMVEGNVNLGSDVNVKPSSEDTNLQIASDVSIESSPAELEGNVNLDTDWQDNVVPEHYVVAIAPEIQEVLTESSLEKVEGNVNLCSDVNVKPFSEDTNLQTTSDVSIGSSPEEFKGNVNLDSDPNVEALSEDINLKTPSDKIPHPTTELPSEIEPPVLGGNSRTKAYYVMGATALTLAVVSIAFAAYKNKKRGRNANEPNDAVGTDHVLSKKTKFSTSSTMEQMYQEKLCSQNWPTESSVGESCPSEMSSFQRNSSSQYDNNNRLRNANEAQSGERRPRKHSKRESFSSSDFSLGGGGGSSSYGSFTTFERIPIKNNATGDDEVVTPVRRSSRLRRSQVTS